MKKSSLSILASLLLLPSLYASTLSKEIQNNSLVVYNSNIGLVHEERELSIKQSEKSIIYEDVAQRIQTDSIHVSLPHSITLLSQQYRFDKLTRDKLLQASIDKKVEVRLLKNRNEFKIIPVTLLAYSGNDALVRTTDYEVISVKSSAIIFSEIPNELITKPSLVWNVEVKQDTKESIALDYLIDNINFKSDYVLNLKGENSASLTGWVNVTNRSGKKFHNISLSLLAGDVNRVVNHTPRYRRKQAMPVMSDAAAVREIAHEGYHIYKIPFKVDLANNEKTQIKFLSKKSIPIIRENVVRVSNPLYVAGEYTFDVEMFVKIAALQEPLPQGVIRTYSQLEGDTIFLGESHIEHTPKNTPIHVKVGKSFDIKVIQTLLQRDDNQKYYNADMRYTLKNSSDTQKIITLEVPFNKKRDSKIETTQEYNFTHGNIVTFKVEVAPKSSKSFEVHYESRR